ncbi:MAG TPA: N-acetylmuramoyl-L-alanine amidase [Lacunisphaera sp.]|nr:N-acetylmuramoyl-L-alanine amidase [Lacunisphaera sp.]
MVTWLEPGGFNAYVTQTPLYGRRPSPGGRRDRDPTLAELQRHVDQFVLHYDGGGLSRICFEVLQKRGLSVHFLLDVDGTIYQTLDLQERAWHAGMANDRSIGVEIANIGAYAPREAGILDKWYQRGPAGQTRLVPPRTAGVAPVRTPGFQGRPQRPERIRGRINARELVQYDFTPQQYAALIKLTAALHQVFPGIALDYPRDQRGRLVAGKLTDAQLAGFRGVLGHFHIDANKYDPGPAFQWDPVIARARRESPSAHTPDQP